MPRSTGNLAAKLARTSRPWRSPQNIYKSGVGDLRQIGNPGRAPRGTIKAFLKDYPRFRRRSKRGFRKSQAWWILSAQAKAVLQQEREAGKYGGGYMGIGSGKAGYFFQQEGSQDDWAASAAKAEISPTNFVENAIQMWTEQDIVEVAAMMAVAWKSG